MRILMLSATFPYPPTLGGTQVRTFYLLKYLQQRHQVTLLTQADSQISQEHRDQLQSLIPEMIVFARPTVDQRSGPVAKLGRLAQSWRKLTPINVLVSYSTAMQAWIDAHWTEFDVITCEHSVNEVYVRSGWPAVANIHSSVYGSCRNQLASQTSKNPWRDRLNLPLLYHYERRYSQKFKALVVTTEVDQQQLRHFNPDIPIEVVTNGVDLAKFPLRSKEPAGQQLIFTGAMDYDPNIDAAQFLCREILPPLRRNYPGVTVAIVGDRPAPAVQALAEIPGVIVTGRVPSMVDYLHRATVCVLPLRTGFGIKNKALEALAAGVPVVGSDRALEGLPVDGDHVPLRALRANHTEAYLSAITRLLEQPDLRQTLSTQGRSLVAREYTWEIVGAKYERVLLQASQKNI